MENKTYIAIDLKSFYASVECVERGLDPLTTRLVVADESRTEKTICLAVTPALKAYGVSGRARLFEAIQIAKENNIDFITATPRMALYLKYSSRIYDIYLDYFSEEDIHVYSIDEVFIDCSAYTKLYKTNVHDLVKEVTKKILSKTGITATAGIGTNLYLCKIAMDIVAKKQAPDADGVRIACLDEMSYRKLLWNHRPLSDFWRIGRATAKTLEKNGLLTMGDVARCSLGKSSDYYNNELLYKLFGINAELLIDHAWGYESATISDIRAYRPKIQCKNYGQVLTMPYTVEKARIVLREMLDSMSLELTEYKITTDQIIITIGYDIESLIRPEIKSKYKGPIKKDHYGRLVPVHAHGTFNLSEPTSSSDIIIEGGLSLYDKIINPILLVRRITIVANHISYGDEKKIEPSHRQLSFFDAAPNEKIPTEKEKRLQQAEISIKQRYGRNAILKGTSFEEGATTRDRNSQIGGHKA